MKLDTIAYPWHFDARAYCALRSSNCDDRRYRTSRSRPIPGHPSTLSLPQHFAGELLYQQGGPSRWPRDRAMCNVIASGFQPLELVNVGVGNPSPCARRAPNEPVKEIAKL